MHCNAMECNELSKLCVLYPIRVHFGKCIVLHYTCRNKKSTPVSVHELPFPLHKLQLREEQGAGGEVEAQGAGGEGEEQGARGEGEEQGAGGEVEKQGGGAEVLEPRAAAADGCTVTVLQVRLNSSA